jgi:hypothetical protein
LTLTASVAIAIAGNNVGHQILLKIYAQFSEIFERQLREPASTP